LGAVAAGFGLTAPPATHPGQASRHLDGAQGARVVRRLLPGREESGLGEFGSHCACLVGGNGQGIPPMEGTSKRCLRRGLFARGEVDRLWKWRQRGLDLGCGGMTVTVTCNCARVPMSTIDQPRRKVAARSRAQGRWSAIRFVLLVLIMAADVGMRDQGVHAEGSPKKTPLTVKGTPGPGIDCTTIVPLKGGGEGGRGQVVG